MSRGLFIGCALLIGTGIVAFHAAEPDCEGWYCLRSAESPVVQLAAEQVGDLEASSDAAKPAFKSQPTVVDVVAWPDVDHSNEAGSPETATLLAPNPTPGQLSKIAAEPGTFEEDVLGREGAEVPTLTPEQWRAAKIEAKKAADAWEALTLAALQEPDPIKRGQAISDVGNHRSEDAVGVLLEVATYDAEADNRYQALQSLWYSAADGLDSDGAIKSTLSAATNDPDERIAYLAKSALEDLGILEAAQ